MSVLDTLAPDGDVSYHLRVTNVTRGTNEYGDYIRMDGELHNGTFAFIYVNSKDFALAEPYVQRWKENDSCVMVPIFFGRDDRWRFSANSARRELGLSAEFVAISYERERPTIKGEIAERLRREAERRHLTVSELSMLLLDQLLQPL